MNSGAWGAFRACFFIGLVLALPAIYMMWRQAKLKKDCTAKADAIVVDCVEKVSHNRVEDKKNTYETTYTYETKYKYSVEGVEYAGSNDRESKEGESFKVFYDPADPKRHYSGKISVFWGWWTWFTFLGGFLMISAVLILIL